VSILLIVGVVGGLMAPLPSDADPVTVTITVTDVTAGTAAVSATVDLYAVTATQSTCPTVASGFYCYGIKTNDVNGKLYGPSNRQVKILNAPNQTAQVQVTDFGQNCDSSKTTCDSMIATGFQLVPACASNPCTSTQWPSSQKVKVQIDVTNTFNQQPGLPSNGSTTFHMFGMTIGGFFGSNSIGDIAQLYAKGTFSQNCKDSNGNPITCPNYNVSNDQNPDADIAVNPVGCKDTIGHVPPESPLCWTIAYPGTTTSFQNSQKIAYYPGSPSGTRTVQGITSPYPFGCSNNAAAANRSLTDVVGVVISYKDPSCQPSETVTYVYTWIGPDTVTNTASVDSGGGGPCSIDGKGKTPFCDCQLTSTNSVCEAIKTFVNHAHEKENVLQVGIQASTGCDPNNSICTATLLENYSVTPDPSAANACTSTIGTFPVPCNQFPFIAAGPRIDNFVITADPITGRVSAPPFTNLITGTQGILLVIYPDYPNWPRPDANSYYTVDQGNITITGTSTANTSVVVLSCPTGNKYPLVISSMDQNVTISVDTHIHNSKTPGVVCPLP
jgi:hypothetical protein